MGAPHSTSAVKAGILGIVLALPGCPSAAVDPCNADTDCDSGLVCVLGMCAPAEQPAEDAGDVSGADAGDADAGDADAGSVDAGDVSGADAGDADAGLSDAGTPDAGGCPSSEHDGGDGQCVALGSCSAGFSIFYVDTDLDGVGDGAASADCVREPLVPGQSAVDGDCEPNDPAKFQLQQGFDDRDLDSYTAGAIEACVGDVPEQGIVDDERGPPVLAHANSVASSGSNNPWNSTSSGWACCGGTTVADLDPAAATAALVLSDFDCLAVPQRIDSVRVRARVRLPALSSQQELAMAVTLVQTGTDGAELRATSTWLPNTFTLVELEGAPADWGIGVADPASLCAGALDARVVVIENGSYGGNVEIDYVVVELLGDSDCDPADATLYSPLSLYGNGDSDQYFGGAPLASCVGDATREDWKPLWPADCDDGDDRAFPGQTTYYSGQRNSGGWDYDCNGSEDKRSVTDALGCVDPGDATCTPTSTASRSGNCGQQIDADDCPAVPPCDLIEDTDAIACR